VSLVRVAVVRGPNLNPWELANLPAGAEIVAIGSRRGAFAAHDLGVDPLRLASPADALGRLPRLGQGLVRRFTGPVEHLFGLERALRGFDVAHVAELDMPYTGQALRAREAGAVRRVVATIWQNIPLPAVENPLVARRVRAAAAGLDYAIAITERARLHLTLAGVPEERVEVLPMGVDVERFAPAAFEPISPGRPLRVLSVTRLVSEKGVEDLVVAVRLLADRGVAAELMLAGAGPLRGRLEAMARELGVTEQVRFEGTVPYERMPELHGRSDVFVLASAPRATWREQFGFAVVEAMASGLPVLAGASGSLDEVVGDDAQLVRSHDAPALADALGVLAAEPGLRAERGRANRRRAEARYDRRHVADRLLDVYRRVLELSPRR